MQDVLLTAILLIALAVFGWLSEKYGIALVLGGFLMLVIVL